MTTLFWTTHDGKHVRPADMNDFHLRGAMNKLAAEIVEKQTLHHALETELARRDQAALATVSRQPPSSI